MPAIIDYHLVCDFMTLAIVTLKRDLIKRSETSRPKNLSFTFYFYKGRSEVGKQPAGRGNLIIYWEVQTVRKVVNKLFADI